MDTEQAKVLLGVCAAIGLIGFVVAMTMKTKPPTTVGEGEIDIDRLTNLQDVVARAQREYEGAAAENYIGRHVVIESGYRKYNGRKAIIRAVSVDNDRLVFDLGIWKQVGEGFLVVRDEPMYLENEVKLS